LHLPAHAAGKCKLAGWMTVFSLYARIWRTYFSWARSLLLLATAIFVPLGLVHAIPVHFEVESLDFGGGLKIFAISLALLALTGVGLLGEVFYAGAVTILLTHPGEDHEPPSLRRIAAEINYLRLIVIDVLYVVLVALGLALLVVPGVLAFIYLGLAAPVVEMEGRTVRGALARSWRLVRGRFWLVFAVLVPIEIANDAITDLATALTHALLGNSLFAEWLTDTVSNIVLTPFYAVAAVLLAIDLIAARDGAAPQLHSAPVSR
jgi:hypothetical protein